MPSWPSTRWSSPLAPAAQPAAQQQAVARARPGDVGDAIALGLVGLLAGRGRDARRRGRRATLPRASRSRRPTSPSRADRDRARARPASSARGRARTRPGTRGPWRRGSSSARPRPPPPTGRRVGLAQVARVAQAHLLDEAGEVGPAIALVGARRAHAACARCRSGARRRARSGRRARSRARRRCARAAPPGPSSPLGAHEPVVELLEALHERAVALGQALELPELDRPVERALRGGRAAPSSPSLETPTSGEASTTSSAWSSKRLRSSAR